MTIAGVQVNILICPSEYGPTCYTEIDPKCGNAMPSYTSGMATGTFGRSALSSDIHIEPFADRIRMESTKKW